MIDINNIIGQLDYIESRLYHLAEETDHYYHYSHTDDIRIDVTSLIRDLCGQEDESCESCAKSLWIPIEEKRPRAGQFVLMKNENRFVAFACRLKGTDDYFIRKGQKFRNPIAWTTKDRLCSME